ncbi:hypothetical protein [Laribacter hongkongensis]|uniref:hypothetical protein n=1 Tax=Laribacter hongkongensis TaxID=168471 RepID=UPI001EFEBDCD|nr:hypothetical protein [Laribacter hongkongensis]MCG9084209.1 hypothetical protein [Laribacter hongkongensis]
MWHIASARRILLFVALQNLKKNIGEIKAPCDLVGLPVLDYFQGKDVGHSKWKLYKKNEVVEVNVTRLTAFDNDGLLLRAGLNGEAIFQSPIHMALPYLLDGKLERVLPDWTLSNGWTMHLITPKRKDMSKRLILFSDWVRRNFSEAWIQNEH